MTVDSIYQDTLIFIDTLKVASVDIGDKIKKTNPTDFDVERTLLTALIGALIAQGLIILISWSKTKIDLKTKKKLILTDLKKQKEILIRLKGAYQELLKKYDNKNADKHSYESFEDLHLDIYNSVAKTDLYKIFKTKITDIVNVYKTIEFLKKYSVDRIYSDYITKLDNHLHEKRNDPKHDYYCSTHLSYIDIAKGQLINNIKTVDELLTDIETIIL